MQADLYDLLADLGAHVERDDTAARANVEENIEEIQEGLVELSALELPRGSRAQLQHVREQAARIAARARDVPAVEAAIVQEQQRSAALATDLKALLEGRMLPIAARRLATTKRRALAASEQAVWVSGILVPVFLLVAIAGIVFLTRSVTRPVRLLIAGMEAVEREGLGARVGAVGDDELGVLAGHFDRMVARLESTTVSRDRLEASEVELRQMAGEFSYQAGHDALTGLPNRREFDRWLASAVELAGAGSSPGVLCYVDLDQFKVVNDTCGHGAGDELLRGVAAALSGAVRDGDILARLGGDEFGLVLFCPLEEGEAAGERLRQAVARTFE